MNRTKVLHLITMLELGGAQQNTLFTVANLDRKRFEVSLAYGPGGILDAEAEKIPDLRRFEIRNLVRPIHPLKDFLCILELAELFKKERPDFVHTHSSKAGIVGRIAARMAGVPCIVHSIHGFGFNPYQNFLVRNLFILLERLTAPWTAKLVAVSSENIREGLSLGIGTKEQYELIRSGVDLEKIRKTAQASDRTKLRAALGLSPDQKAVLTVGPFKPQKDPVAFVRMAARAAKNCSQAVFLMVGDGELRPQVEAAAREGNLGDRLKLLGWRRDIPELLNACDLFALTSLWEGLPRSGVEALIVGKPVVACAVNGVPEIVREGENGSLFPPRQPETMGDRVAQILNDDALLKRLSENAAASIGKSFDIHFMVEQQEALYAGLSAPGDKGLTKPDGVVKMV
jgi:glycosyltransferase involved in cell wall biosynthesis